jgi:RHS repeat-associated protein
VSCTGQPTGCAAGKLAKLVTDSGVSLDLGYDGLLATSSTWSGAVSGSVSRSYDAAFRVATETVQAGTTTSTIHYGYDQDDLVCCASTSPCTCAAPGTLGLSWNATTGFLQSMQLGGVADAFTYNAFGELATHTTTHVPSSTTLFSGSYDTTSFPRDGLGRITKKTEALLGQPAEALRFAYDAGGRLDQVFRTSGAGAESLFEDFGYDPNGNRTSHQHAAFNCAAAAGGIDDQDRLLALACSDGGGAYQVTFTYTDNGELLTKNDSRQDGSATYTYDLRGNLRKVELPGGSVIEYLIDGFDRRVGKKKNGVLVKQWLYRDGLRIAAELDGSGAVLSRFVYASQQNAPDFVIRVQEGKTYRIIADYLGSPRVVVNVADPTDVALRVDYEAFGRVATADPGDLGFVAMGFAGGVFDADTGLVRFGARDYDPAVGGWITKDPIRFDGGYNLYAYVGNDPVNFIDPEGTYLGEWDCLLAGELIIAGATIAWAAPGWWKLGGAGVAAIGVGGLLVGACDPKPTPPPAPPPPTPPPPVPPPPPAPPSPSTPPTPSSCP